jgi:hypothetical protein
MRGFDVATLRPAATRVARSVDGPLCRCSVKCAVEVGMRVTPLETRRAVCIASIGVHAWAAASLSGAAG